MWGAHVCMPALLAGSPTSLEPCKVLACEERRARVLLSVQDVLDSNGLSATCSCFCCCCLVDKDLIFKVLLNVSG